MRRLFAGIISLSIAGPALSQPPAPPAVESAGAVPFSGVHAVDMTAAPNGAPAPMIYRDNRGSPNRYIDMRFLSLKTTTASQKEPLIQRRTRVTGSTVDVELDTYRTGVVNTGDQPGIHLLIGQWTDSDTAYELGATYINPFFYKRIFDALTVQQGGSTTSTTVTYLPTDAPLDFAYVYYKTYHWGLESNMRRRFVQDECQWIDAILGLRYHQIHERYNIDVAPVQGVGVQESYHTGNDIFGVQLGLEADRSLCDYVSIRGVAKYVLGFNSQWRSFRGTPGASLLTDDASRGYQDDWKFGNFADLSIAVVGKLTPNIETSFGVTSLIFGGVERAANNFDLFPLDGVQLKDGQDWLMLYGFQWTVKIDF